MTGRAYVLAIVAIVVMLAQIASTQTIVPSTKADSEIAKAVGTLLDSTSAAVVRSLTSGRGSDFRIGNGVLTFTDLDDYAATLMARPGESALAHRVLGFLQFMRHQYEEAEMNLGKSIELAPAAAQPYFLRALIRLAREQRTTGIDDLTACLKRSPSKSPWRIECEATLEHAKRNPTGEEWVSYRDDRDGVAFSHPRDWDVLSVKTPKVFDYFVSVGLTREAADLLVRSMRESAGGFLVVNPYDATAVSIEIRDVGQVVAKEAVAKMWRAAAADGAQFERQNAKLFKNIRVRSKGLAEVEGGLRIDFAFGFQLPILDAQLQAVGWRTMMFKEKAPSRTVRVEYLCGQQFLMTRELTLNRVIDSLDFWIPGTR